MNTHIYIYIWVFPKMVAPPKHPNMVICSRRKPLVVGETHGKPTILGNIHIYISFYQQKYPLPIPWFFWWSGPWFSPSTPWKSRPPGLSRKALNCASNLGIGIAPAAKGGGFKMESPQKRRVSLGFFCSAPTGCFFGYIYISQSLETQKQTKWVFGWFLYIKMILE